MCINEERAPWLVMRAGAASRREAYRRFAKRMFPGEEFVNTVPLESAAGEVHRRRDKMMLLKLPDTIPFVSDDGCYPMRELAARLRAWVWPIAQALDLQNSNNPLTHRLDQPAY